MAQAIATPKAREGEECRAPSRTNVKTILIVLAASAALLLGAAAFVVYAGLYDISATKPHTQPVYSLLETTMRRSVQVRARQVAVPPLDAPERLARGAACFRDHCVQCHGGPGVAPAPMARSMQPLPGSLIDAARHWRPQEIYLITRDGIKMSGMPAWALRLDDDELWSVVAFVDRLPRLSPAAYESAIAGAGPDPCLAGSARVRSPATMTLDDRRELGRAALQQYSCTACHTVPGIAGSDPQIGPPLAGLASRTLLAGRLVNSEDNLVRWIRDPRSIDPRTAMPALDVSEEHARAMASYLATLR
jgi:mono/diheme cytochrome c family protein